MFDWTIVGPLLIVVLAVALGFLRRYVLRKKKERISAARIAELNADSLLYSKVTKILEDTKTTRGEANDQVWGQFVPPKDDPDDLRDWTDEDWNDAATGKRVPGEPPAPKEPTTEDKYDAMREKARKRQDITSKAYQEAQYRAVELNEPVMLVFHDPRLTADGAMLYSITPCPLDDPRRKGIDSPLGTERDARADVIVIDNRPLGHEMIDETKEVMPATEREKYENDTYLREKAIREASSPEVSAEIDAHKLYKRGIDQKARQEFEQALPEIRAEAEVRAALMAEAPARHASLLAEAQERGIGYPEVLAEFVAMVAETAVKEAKERFQRGNSTGNDPLIDSFGKAILAGGWKY